MKISNIKNVADYWDSYRRPDKGWWKRYFKKKWIKQQLKNIDKE